DRRVLVAARPAGRHRTSAVDVRADAAAAGTGRFAGAVRHGGVGGMALARVAARDGASLVVEVRAHVAVRRPARRRARARAAGGNRRLGDRRLSRDRATAASSEPGRRGRAGGALAGPLSAGLRGGAGSLLEPRRAALVERRGPRLGKSRGRLALRRAGSERFAPGGAVAAGVGEGGRAGGRGRRRARGPRYAGAGRR